jgi:hypothetical protein
MKYKESVAPDGTKKMDDGSSNDPGNARTSERWARFRFSVVAHLLPAPPPAGELHGQLRLLAAQSWRHPVNGEPIQIGVSTLERWYYRARNAKDPIQALARKIRSDQGQHPPLSSRLREALATQYRDHPSWSYQLHADNLAARVEAELRLLSSADPDSRSILTVILAGDSRLSARLESLDLLPLASRIRSRLRTESLPPQQLLQCLEHLLASAGNPKLMPVNLLRTLSEHAAGNLRLLMNLGNDLLAAALRQERDHLDEKLFFEVFTPDPKARSKRS